MKPIGYMDCVWFQLCSAIKKSTLPMSIIRQNKISETIILLTWKIQTTTEHFSGFGRK